MAHTFDTSLRIPATGTSVATVLTGNYTCGIGATVLVLSLMYGGSVNRSGGAPTYNGIPLIPVSTPQRATVAPECTVEMWFLINPPTGSSLVISVPNLGGLAMKAVATSAKAASGASFIDARAVTANTSTNPSIGLDTTANGCIIFSAIANGAQIWAPTARTATQVMDEDLGNWGAGVQYFLQSTAGQKVMGWTFATSEDYGLIAVSFKEIIPSIGSINITRLNDKLNTIQSKNVDAIMAKNVNIPFLGQGYTREQLQNWISERVTELEYAKTADVVLVDNRIATHYESLSLSDRIIADNIINGKTYDLGLASSLAAYNKLSAIALDIFVTRN